MAEKIRWGILGCGNIAGAFAKDLKLVDNAQLVAVGSKSIERAKTFANNFGAKQAFGSYGELAACKDVDAIYVATHHPMHFENSMLSLENDKAVLCEKPFTINSSQAKQLVDFARTKKKFLMEAMWTRFIPATLKVQELLTKNVIGQIKSFRAGFGEQFDLDSRGYDFNLAGGALLDLGVYPISFASMVFQAQPKQIASVVSIGSTGVDLNESLSFLYDNDAVASITAGIQAKTLNNAVISGTLGRIEIDAPFFRSNKVTLKTLDGKDKVFKLPFKGAGYRFEAEHVGNCLLQSKTESNVMTLDENIRIMETMDKIR